MYAKRVRQTALVLSALFVTQVTVAQVNPPVGQSAGPAASAPLQAASAPPGSIAALAPTINMLSQLQRSEIETEARKRLEKLNPPPPVAPVKAASAAAAPIKPVADVVVRQPPKVVPPPDTTKTVVAIYGRRGQEEAEIALPDGSVVKVAAGTQRAGFKVVRVESAAVVLEVVMRKTPPADAVRSAKGGDTKVHRRPGDKSAKPNMESQSAGDIITLLTLPVGGTFK